MAVTDRISWKTVEVATADWDALVLQADVVHYYVWSSLPASANANPAGDLLANISPLLGLLDALKRRGRGRVVFASSGGTVYGRLHRIPAHEDDPLAPITAYGASKATAELYLNLYRGTPGLDCRIARIANVFGAGQDLSRGLGAVTTFLHHSLTGQKIVIWGNGEVVRDYIHVSDVALCLVRMACVPLLADSIFNVGSANGTSLNQVIAELQNQSRRPLQVEHAEKRSFDVPVNVLNIDRARKNLHWSPRLSFSQGIAQTLSDLETGEPFSTLSDE
jgi:UDP-glucose 4-epimerase